MVGWHHQLDRHEFEWAPGVGDGQGKPDLLQSMQSKRVRHDWATELIDTDRWLALTQRFLQMKLKQTKVHFEANSLLRVLVSLQNMLIKQIRVSFSYLLLNVKTKVLEGGEYMYTYSWFTLYRRKQHSKAIILKLKNALGVLGAFSGYIWIEISGYPFDTWVTYCIIHYILTLFYFF